MLYGVMALGEVYRRRVVHARCIASALRAMLCLLEVGGVKALGEPVLHSALTSSSYNTRLSAALRVLALLGFCAQPSMLCAA